VTVETDGKPVAFPVSDVEKANLVFELSPQPKRGRPKSSKKSTGNTGHPEK
jgi:hypothetical protein